MYEKELQLATEIMVAIIREGKGTVTIENVTALFPIIFATIKDCGKRSGDEPPIKVL